MLRVGVIGVGHLGKHHARIYSEIPNLLLAGVADIRRDRVEEIARLYNVSAYTDFHEMIGNVDAVSIAVPTGDHAKVGVELLSAGIDVLVEKPIASTVEDAATLIRVAERNSRVLQVGHVERFNPVVKSARDIATRPQFFEIHRLGGFSARSLDIDVVLDLMIHDIDIVLSFVGSPVEEVRAVGIPILSDKIDIANARIEFADGCVANLTASRVSADKVRKLRFFQPHDYISLDYSSQQGTVHSLRGGRIVEQKLEPARQEPLRVQLEAFADAVRRREPAPVSGKEGLRALELALMVNRVIHSRGKLTH